MDRAAQEGPGGSRPRPGGEGRADFIAPPVIRPPPQDKYCLVGVVRLPAGTSLDRTEAVARDLSGAMPAEPGVAAVAAFPGLSINGWANLPNAAALFAVQKPFEERRAPDLSAGAIAQWLQARFFAVPDGIALVFPPPPRRRGRRGAGGAWRTRPGGRRDPPATFAVERCDAVFRGWSAPLPGGVHDRPHAADRGRRMARNGGLDHDRPAPSGRSWSIPPALLNDRWAGPHPGPPRPVGEGAREDP